MILQYFLKKKHISFILIAYCSCIQSLLALEIKKYNYNYNELFKLTTNNHYSINKYNTMHIESNTAEILYPQKITLFGNVLIKQNNNIIKSNKLTIYNNYNYSNILELILCAEGHVLYQNKNFKLTGSYAKFNLNNNNIDLHQGTYYIDKPHIHGSATSIMQRENNRYTIIKKGNFTTCISNNNHWNITGSKIIYDHLNNYIHIWNAYLKITKIPLFYSPYLLLSMNKNNILESYIPNIQYNDKYGLILKTPFPLIFSKYYSGSISPCYISKIGIGLDTKIYYQTIPGTGLLSCNIVQNNTNNNTNNNNKYYKLYWKHHGIINKKWHINANYLFKDDFKNNFCNLNNNEFKFIDNYINQKILCYYSNDYYKISIAYLKNLHTDTTHTTQNRCIYSVSPQLETYSFFNFNQKNSLNFQIFNQFSKFVPSNPIYPKSIRIHTEPIINFTIYNKRIICNTETKLKMTHYQQNNIDYYNTNQNNQKYHLKYKINRIIPQFKINGKMMFHKTTNDTKEHKYFLESKLQYLYIPYFFQENIGIYDTKMIHTNHNNLFRDIQYSGLDRIESANKITGNILIRCINQHNDKFYISIGQILNLTQSDNYLNHTKTKPHLYVFNTIPKTKLCFSSIGQWNFNNNWTIRAEIQYDTYIKRLSFGNTTLEYIDKNNTIFQTNYRYINSQYFRKNLLQTNHLIHYQTISQLGFITYYPLINNWIINCTHYHNIMSNSLIDQTIGIQYFTSCWMFGVIFERNIVDWNNQLHINLYENKIRINFNLFSTKPNSQLNIYKFLNSKKIPYQRALNNI